MGRVIRLKEYPPCSTMSNTPPGWYVEEKNSTLPNKAYTVRTDRNGFIRSANDEGEFQRELIVLGDSVVESLYLDEGLRFCSVLQDLLCEQLPGRVRICNAGYSGATTLHL